MKKIFKVLATTAVLAAIIPMSAYAVDIGSRTDKANPTVGKDAVTTEHPFMGKHGFDKGFMTKKIGQDALKKLNLDEKTLKDRLAKGETLAQIAQEQGVSREDLKNLLTTAFNQALDKQKADFAANLDNLVDAKHQPGDFTEKRGRKGFKHGQPLGQKLDMIAVAQLLGMSNADLKESLSSGKSLADLATEKGVDVQKLIDLQVNALLKGSGQDLKDGKITQAEYDKRKADFTNIATKLVNNKNIEKIKHGEDKNGKDKIWKR